MKNMPFYENDLLVAISFFGLVVLLIGVFIGWLLWG